MADVERVGGVTAASATVTGSGFATRADARAPIVIRGIDPERFLAIIDMRRRMVQGSLDVTGGGVAIGSTLASDLGSERRHHPGLVDRLTAQGSWVPSSDRPSAWCSRSSSKR